MKPNASTIPIAGRAPAGLKAVDVPAGFRSDLARWKQLVQVAWLADLIRGHAVAAAPAPDWLLLEVGCDGWQAYRDGHIPGARYLDTQNCEQLPFWNVVPDTQLRAVFGGLGIHRHSSVILYGRNQLAAARVAHLLLYAGVADVRLIDGGYAAWCAEGRAVETGAPSAVATPVTEFDPGWPVAFPAWPQSLLDPRQAMALSTQAGAVLVSIRSRAEFMGEISGYDFIEARGEIPGARWGHAGRDGDVNHMGSFHDAAGQLLPAAEIERMWAEAGIRRDMRVAFYCGTGWRASLAFFYAWLMGWDHISVYDGGWMEWSSDAANPVVCHADPGYPSSRRPRQAARRQQHGQHQHRNAQVGKGEPAGIAAIEVGHGADGR